MSGWLVRTLLLAVLAMSAMQGMRPMVSYRALELGASAVDLGVVAASFALLAVASAAPLGRWIDRFGEPRFLVGGTTIVTFTALGLSLANSLIALIAAQAMLGLGQVIALIGIQTIVANGGGKAGRDARIGAFTVTGSLAQMIGPTLSGFLYGTVGLASSQVFLLGALPALVSVALGISLWVRPPARVAQRRPADEPPQQSLMRTVATVMRQPSVPHAMLASLTVLTSIDLLIAYLPAYGEATGIAASTIGVMLGVRAAGGMVSRLLMLKLLRRWARRQLLIASMLLPTVALIALPLTTTTVVLIALLAVAGLGLGLGQPLSLAWVADQVPRSIRGTAIGVRITGNRLGQLLIPMALGVVAGATGIGAIFVTSGAMLGASSLLLSRAPHAPSRD